jgi:hypothetical protein
LGAVLLLATLLSGCWQRSVHPFHSESDIVPEPALAGTWHEPPDPTDKPGTDKDRMAWTFTAVDPTRHHLVITDGKERYEYEARAFQLGDAGRFLDLFSKEHRVDTIPAHHLFRLLDVGETLRLAPLDPEWMARWLRANPQKLAHARVPSADTEDAFVLTAETAALQRFVREHLHDDGFFAEPMVLQKEGAKPAAHR